MNYAAISGQHTPIVLGSQWSGINMFYGVTQPIHLAIICMVK